MGRCGHARRVRAGACRAIRHRPRVTGMPRQTLAADVDTAAAGPALRLSRSDRWQPLLLIGAIALGLGFARVAPGVAGSLFPLVSIGVAVLIHLIMLGLDPRRLRLGRGERRFVLTAIVLNFVVVPVVAWGLGAVLLSDHPELRIGLLLFLVTPCIGWFLVFIDLAGGDTALGVNLLAVNLVLQVLLLPVYVQIFAGTSTGTDLGDVASSLGLYFVAPTVLAVATRSLLRHRRPRVDPAPGLVADATSGGSMIRRPSMGTVKTGTLLVVIGAMFASQADTLTEDPSTLLRVVVPMVAFFAIMFVVALAVARAGRLGFEQTVVLVFTTASRNSEASLAIAATAFANPLVAAVVAIGPAIELPILMLMVRALRTLR